MARYRDELGLGIVDEINDVRKIKNINNN